MADKNYSRTDKPDPPDLVATAAALGIETRREGVELVGKVPWRVDEHPSLRLNPAKGRWFDNPSGDGGGSFDLIMRTRGVTFREAVEWAIAEGLTQAPPAAPLAQSSNRAVSVRPCCKPLKGATWGKGQIVDVFDYVDESGAVLYLVARVESGEPDPVTGKRKKDFPQFHEEHGKWWPTLHCVTPAGVKGVEQVRKVLWRLPELASAERIILVEGEKCVKAGIDLERAMLEAGGVRSVFSCNSEGAGKWPEDCESAVDGKAVAIFPDFDTEGENHAIKVAAKLYGRVASLKIVRLPDLPQKGDLADWIPTQESAEAAASALLELIDSAPEWHPPDKSKPPPRKRIWTPLSEIESKPVFWLWSGFVPLGKITVISGDPGLGKSTLSVDLAARLSTGRPMPGQNTGIEPAGAVLLSGEDDPGDTIKPRAEAAGGDMDRIVIIKRVGAGKDERLPSIPDDLPLIEAAITETQAKLVVIDPLNAYLGGGFDSFKDQDIRRALFPVADMAERHGVAVILVRHLNKTSGGKAIYRGGGSIGISGAARSELLFGTDPTKPDDDSARILAVTKCNLVKMPRSFQLRLVEGTNGTSMMQWGEQCDLTADDLVSPGGETMSKAPEALGAAKDFILEFLAEGPKASTMLCAEALKAGIKMPTLKRAKKQLCIKARKDKFGSDGGWLCELPESITGGSPDQRSSPRPKEAHAKEMSLFESDDPL